MANGKFIAYYRVSTAKQGQSGLGMDAQREAVTRYLSGGQWELLAEFEEHESGKGADALGKRARLRAAMDACRKHGATLLIAKLDRLARNVHFVSGLMESKVRFLACDMPEANELTIHIMAAFAEHEAKRISQRTKDALAAAKARGVKLGKPENLRGNVAERMVAADVFASGLAQTLRGYQAAGLSQRRMVEELNRLGIRTPKGGDWHLAQLQRVLARIPAVLNDG
ncbi:recombinase family protein [Ralstonia soli]|uniref:Recombinase family protein n=1 Tax=Ralstonia soli TaxID=2953896 RepID=A0ABT1AIV8_9RALS|nr:recombinase family protein [Ralstonia soli]MCO5398330.1 recombinase family protein [Ralstonia soli]